MKRILSGVKPTGDLHVGNYLGAIRNWVDAQAEIADDDIYLFMIADLHTMTVPFEPVQLKQTTRELAAWYLAMGLDPEKVSIFMQSENPDHPYLGWIFNCLTPLGWLERMTQYKDKSAKGGERVSAGLLTYPTLMAADILLYDADEVPVGEDQEQHIELTRDLVDRCNSMFGELFVLPKFVTVKSVTRIMSLQNPDQKMSKSDPQQTGVLRLNDSSDVLAQKIKKAETDSDSVVRYDPATKPAISNLLSIYAGLSGKSVEAIEKEYEGKGYGQFKADLAEVVVDGLRPIQERFAQLMADSTYLDGILDKGGEQARSISSKKIRLVQEKLGLTR